MAQGLHYRAQAAMAERRDPRPALDEALAEAAATVTASGDMAELRFLHGLLLAEAAIIEVQLEGDPTAHLDTARPVLKAFHRHEPDGFRRHFLDLLFAAVEIRQATREGRWSEIAVRAGKRSLAWFLERPKDPMGLQLMSNFLLSLAAAEIARGGDALDTLTRGFEATRTRRGVQDALRLGQRGAFLVLAATAATDAATQDTYLVEAEGLLARALADNRWLWAEFEPWQERLAALRREQHPLG